MSVDPLIDRTFNFNFGFQIISVVGYVPPLFTPDKVHVYSILRIRISPKRQAQYRSRFSTLFMCRLPSANKRLLRRGEATLHLPSGLTYLMFWKRQHKHWYREIWRGLYTITYNFTRECLDIPHQSLHCIEETHID